MRRLIDQRQKSLPRAKRGAFLHESERVDRQTLLLAALGAFAPEADGEFPRGEPVESLATVAKDCELSLRQQPPQKVRPEVRAVIEQPDRAAAGAWRADVAHLHPAFPFGIQKIAERGNFLRVDELRVVVDLPELGRADVAEEIALLRIGIAMRLAPPFRLVQNFRQQQRRLDWIEQLRLIEVKAPKTEERRVGKECRSR